jgi:hypothetical protein
MKSNPYVICIPSYQRAHICNEKTLKTLHHENINPKLIYVYVVKEEYELYKKTLDPSYYHQLIIGKKGLVQQRDFIMNQWENGKQIVFFDDDILKIDLSLSSLFKHHSLDYFLQYAFQKCHSNHAFIWGVYAVYNPYFRKGREEMSSCLNYIVGAFYGIINRPRLKSIQLSITKENGQKEDVERTLKYFIHDDIVLRFNRVGFLSIYYGKEGGLGTFQDRLKPMLIASKKLEKIYAQYGSLSTRKNGMTEFKLKKIKSATLTKKHK